MEAMVKKLLQEPEIQADSDLKRLRKIERTYGRTLPPNARYYIGQKIAQLDKTVSDQQRKAYNRELGSVIWGKGREKGKEDIEREIAKLSLQARADLYQKVRAPTIR